MKKNPLLLVGLIFALVGFLLVGVAFTTLRNHNEFMETAVPVEAFIDSIIVTDSANKKSYDVHVYYIYDNKTISNELNFYNSSMHEGDIITLYCDPMNPYHVEEERPIFSIIFMAIGGTFATIGVILIILNFRVKKTFTQAQLINAQITNVFMNYNVTVNGRHPYKIECGYLASNGQYFQFISKDVWTNPQSFIGQVCPVYVNPNDPSKYSVDTSWLGN